MTKLEEVAREVGALNIGRGNATVRDLLEAWCYSPNMAALYGGFPAPSPGMADAMLAAIARAALEALRVPSKKMLEAAWKVMPLAHRPMLDGDRADLSNAWTAMLDAILKEKADE